MLQCAPDLQFNFFTKSTMSLADAIQPKIVKNLKGTIAEKGTDVIFEAGIEGSPAPKCVWIKDNQQVWPQAGKFTITNQPGITRLTIHKATFQDNGQISALNLIRHQIIIKILLSIIYQSLNRVIYSRFKIQGSTSRSTERSAVALSSDPNSTVTLWSDLHSL
ncbi:hypothetical protein M8J75_011930 [Diaphorina citri]|nr:hypothetical protein M8J75_011930 [Diaphorina citri]